MKKFIKGQSLFEVMVALTVIAFIMIGLIQAVTVSIRNTSQSRNNSQATIYATQVSEWLRGERDTTWTTFKAHFNAANSVYCFDTIPPDWSKASACTSTQIINGTPFTRSATFICYTGSFTAVPNCTPVNITMVQATITVSWPAGGQTQSVQIVSNLTNSKSQ